MLVSERGQVAISDLFRFVRVRLKCGQVISDPLGLAFTGKALQEVPGFFHRRVESALYLC